MIVLPAEVDPTNSILSHLPEAADGVAVAGRQTQFRMLTFDRFENARTIGGDQLCLSIFLYGCKAQTESILACTEMIPYFQPQQGTTVIDHTNGTYDLHFTLEKSGDHLGAVNVLPMGAVKVSEQQLLFDEGRGPAPINRAPSAYNETCAAGSHWNALPVIHVVVGPSVTNDTQSVVAGSGLVGGIAGLNISFSIFARDEFGNTQAPGLDEGESFNVLVEYRVIYQQTHRTLSNFQIGAGDNELDVFTFTLDADYNRIVPLAIQQRFKLSFQKELAALAGIDDPAKVSIILIAAQPPDLLVPNAQPMILVDFRLDVTDEVAQTALVAIRSAYDTMMLGGDPFRIGTLVENCIPNVVQDTVSVNECGSAVLDDLDDDVSRAKCEAIQPPPGNINFGLQICKYEPALTNPNSMTQPFTSDHSKFVDSEWITEFSQVIYGNLTIPGAVEAWNPTTLEGRNAQEQLKLGVKEAFATLSGGQLFRQKVYVDYVVDATASKWATASGDALVTVYYRVTSSQNMAFVLSDHFAYVMALYTQINAKGQVVAFSITQIQVDPNPNIVTDVEYNAEADHKYLPGSSGEYYASYRVPAIDAGAIRFVRVSALYCVPGYPCQTKTTQCATGCLWQHESAANIAGSPRFAILLGSPNHLVANASMSSATGPGVEGKFEVGEEVEFVVQIRDYRGIDLVASAQGNTDVDLTVEAPGLDITMVDERNGRFSGYYITNRSLVYNITFHYTEKATRECVQSSPVTGDCTLYDSIPGRTFVINDEPYEVNAYARITLPGNCDGSTAITFDRERVDCDTGRQVGAPASFALMAPDGNHSMWIGDALSIDECDDLAQVFAATNARDAFTVTYSMNSCDCLFPFSYDGVTYNTCTDETSPAGAWCATSPVCQSRFSSDPDSICQLDLARRQEGAYAKCRERGLEPEEQTCPSGAWERGCYAQLEPPGRQEDISGSNMTDWRSCQYQRYFFTETEDVPLRGLIAGIAGRPFDFRLTSRDEYGNVQNNPIYAQSDAYSVTFFSLNDTRAEVFQQVTPDGTGVYTVSLTAQAMGTYAVSIDLNGHDILNPSFYLHVQTSSVHPETSVLAGQGVVLFPVAEQTSFTAQLRDRFGNLAACTQATLDTLVLVGLGNMTEIEFDAACTGQNSMTATYVTTVSGDYMLNVSARNGSVSISAGLYGNQLWPVVVEPAVISADKSSVFFVTTSSGAAVLPGSTVTAKLDLRDRFGNPTDLRLDARGLDLSSGLRLVWSHMADSDDTAFTIFDPSGEMATSTTTLLQLLGRPPISSGVSSTVVPGGLRVAGANFTTTFVPQAYGRYSVRAVVTVDCFNDGTGSLPSECADLDDCLTEPCGAITAGNCTDKGRRVYSCECEPGHHFSSALATCVATGDSICPHGVGAPNQSPPDCTAVVFDEADCPPIRNSLADVLGAVSGASGNGTLSNSSNLTLTDANDLLYGRSDRNCTGLTVLELHHSGVHSFVEQNLELDIGGSPSSFFVSLLGPPNATQASLTSSGLALEIQFDSPTNRAGMSSNVLPCSTILRAVHVPYEEAALRAINPEGMQIPISDYGNLLCSWQSAQVLTVDLTSGVNALDIIRERVPNIPNYLSILPRVLRQAENSAAIHNRAEIVASHDPPVPQAVLTAPVVLPYCDQLVLDASASYGTGGPLSYEWTVNPGTPQRVSYQNNEAMIVSFGMDFDQIALNSRDMMDWLTAQGENGGLLTTSTIYIPQLVTVGELPPSAKARYAGRSDTYNVNLFQPGTNAAPGALNFSVTVTNVFGQSSTAYAAVTRSMTSPPVVSLPSVAARTLYAGESMYLEAAIRLSSCFNVWLYSPQIRWRWSMQSSSSGGGVDYGLDAAMDGASRNTSTLLLSTTGLTPGQSYEVVAAAQMISDPDLVGFASAMISVAYAGVQAVIGNVPSSASAAQFVELDATGSFDRDDPTQTLIYRWTWQLYGAEDGVACLTSDVASHEDAIRALASGSSGLLIIPRNILSPDQRCTFTVQATGLSPDPSFASKIMTILPAEVLPPDVRISQLMPPPTQTQVTACSESVVMEGIISSQGPQGLGNFDAAVGCEWRLVDGDLGDHDIEWYRRPINNAVSRLILPPGTLTEAQLYYVRFACFLDGHEGFADMVFRTNKPPRLGTMSVQKLSEVSLTQPPTPILAPMIVLSDSPFIDLELSTNGWVDEPEDTPFTYTFSTQRSCLVSDPSCDKETGMTNPVVLGSSGTNKRTATIANIGTTNVTVAVRATDRPGGDSIEVKHFIAFQGLPKDDTQSVTIATSIMDGKFATAAATGDFTAVMQLASVLAGILTPSSGGRRLLLQSESEKDSDSDVHSEDTHSHSHSVNGSRLSLSLDTSRSKVLGKDHPMHPLQLVRRWLQDADEIRDIQQLVMNALSVVVAGAKPPSHVIYQYLAAVADIAWVTNSDVHRCCSSPGSSGCFASSCSYGFEMQASDYITTVLEQAAPHNLLLSEAADAAARAIAGVLEGLPSRDAPDFFGHGRAMAMTQLYFNEESSDASTYRIIPTYAVRNCAADTWSIAYTRTNIATRVTTSGFSELEFIPRPCGQGRCECVEGSGATGCWEVVRMGGMISGIRQNRNNRQLQCPALSYPTLFESPPQLDNLMH